MGTFYRSAWWAIIFLVLALPLRAQVVLSIGAPITDSFPIIDVNVNVTYNGAPATLMSGTDFTVTEDGLPASVIGLSGCGGASSAAIALVVDTSSSMRLSLGSGPANNRSYGMFNQAVSEFVGGLPDPSLIALVPFADSSTYYYPDSIKAFFNSANAADTSDLGICVRRFTYDGAGTDVVAGIVEGAQALTRSSLQRRVMILVTDDDITNTDSVEMFLNSLGICLYVLNVSRDSTHIDYPDLQVASGTGGAYFAAYDTTLYAPMLTAISNLIYSEHCTLKYRSSIPCPAWNFHRVQVSLNYNGSIVTADTSYWYGPVRNDRTPPGMTLDTPSFISRVVRAYDPFPCQSGMRSLTDSASQNFTILPRIVTVDSMSDSLIVVDSLYPADAWMLAMDTVGNTSRKLIYYTPQPDTHPPQFDSLSRVGEAYNVNVTEQRPWDRGIHSISLSDPINLALDSVYFANAHLAHTYLHILDLRDTASGCLIATDSSENKDSICIEWGGEGADILPPVIMPSPIAEPIKTLAGTITEERPHDRGIREVSVTPITNTSAPLILYDSAEEARVIMQLDDSLYVASALVKAWDSVGNYAQDTFKYIPMPDTHPPICTWVISGNSAFTFYAADTQAWDRGVASLSLLGSSRNATGNVTQFVDGHRAQLTVNVTDRTLPATITVQAIDSAGHYTTDTVYFSAIPLIPLGDSLIDFGAVFAPRSVTRTITFHNQNDVPVAIDLTSLEGDDSVFRVLTPSPITFPALGTNSVTFEFHPSLIGNYSAVDSMEYHIPVGSVTLLGHSMGTIRMALDTQIVRAGDSGALHLSLEATPMPTNLDTIGFTLTYDPDVIQLGDVQACPNGGPDTGLCMYDAYWAGGAPGNREAILVRNNPDRGTALQFGGPELSLPFVAYLARHDSTIVHIQPLTTYSASVLSAQDGLVMVGDTCGNPALRTFLNEGNVAQRILSVSPNPASQSVTVSMESASATDAEISIVNAMGIVETTVPTHLIAGAQWVCLRNLPESSGAYEVVVKVGGIVRARRTMEIIR